MVTEISWGIVRWVRMFELVFQLTAVRHNKSWKSWECLVGGDKEAPIVERLNFIMFYMMTSSLLPIFHG